MLRLAKHAALYSLLTAVLLLGMGTKAVDAFSGSGGGTFNDPYMITSCAELQSISDEEADEGVLFWLANDIDCSETSTWNEDPENPGTYLGFEPINEFYGTLDGRGNTITGLYIDRPTSDEVGLFESINDGFVTGVYFDETTSITGSTYVGTLAGSANSTIVRDVRSDATITATNYAGGLIGSTDGWQDSLVVQKSQFSGEVTSSGWTGGIIGHARYGYTLNDNQFSGTASGDGAGGMIGHSQDACGYRYINRAWVSGSLTGSSYVGGLVARYQDVSCSVAEINDSVSLATLTGGATAKGGVVAQTINADILSITNTFYDEVAAGTTDCVAIISGGSPTCSDIGGNVPTTDEPYASWDFDTVWESSMIPLLQSPFPLLSGPGAPTSVSVEEGEEVDQANVSWSEPSSDGGYDVNYYRVEIKEAEEDWDNLLDYTTVYEDTNTTFYNLSLSKEYDVRVQAITEYSGGAWTEQSYETQEANNVQVDSCAELMDFDEDAVNRFAHLTLTDDIDCSEIEQFEPIGSSEAWDENSFRGVFDGQGYTISGINLDTDNYNVGLFQTVSRAELKNVTLEDGLVSGEGNVGSLAGEAYSTNISNVHSSMTVNSYDGRAGGLIGYFENDDEADYNVLEYLSFDGTIECIYDCGGLIGEIESDEGRSVNLRKSFTEGELIGDLEAEDGVYGGLVGDVEVDADDDDITAEVIIEDVYSQMSVTGFYSVGGLIGEVDVYNDEYDNAIASFKLSRAYSSGNVSGVNAVGGVIGYIDYNEYEGEQVIFTDVFSASDVNDASEGEGSDINGFAGVYDEDEITVESTNLFFDTNGDTLECSGSNELDDCTGIDESDETDYFTGNSTSAPMDEWDFEGVWHTEEAEYPRLYGSDYERPENPDADNDDITDEVENAGPNNGDANNDGTPDAEQVNVASLVDPVSGEYAVLEVSEECSIESLVIVSEAEVSDSGDANYEYPAGLMDFRIDCDEEGFTATISQYYYGIEGDLTVRKFKPDTGYFTIDSASVSDQSIDGAQVKVATYQVQDGSNLDLDDEINGSIEDPAGLGQQTSLVDELASTGQAVSRLVLAGQLLMLLGLAMPLLFYAKIKAHTS